MIIKITWPFRLYIFYMRFCHVTSNVSKLPDIKNKPTNKKTAILNIQCERINEKRVYINSLCARISNDLKKEKFHLRTHRRFLTFFLTRRHCLRFIRAEGRFLQKLQQRDECHEHSSVRRGPLCSLEAPFDAELGQIYLDINLWHSRFTIVFSEHDFGDLRIPHIESYIPFESRIEILKSYSDNTSIRFYLNIIQMATIARFLFRRDPRAFDGEIAFKRDLEIKADLFKPIYNTSTIRGNGSIQRNAHSFAKTSEIIRFAQTIRTKVQVGSRPPRLSLRNSAEDFCDITYTSLCPGYNESGHIYFYNCHQKYI